MNDVYVDVWCIITIPGVVTPQLVKITSGDFVGRYFYFFLKLGTREFHTTPVVKGITITIDMPDRIVSDSNISTSSSANTTITFSPAFHTLKAVGITGNNLATGDYIDLVSSDRTGFVFSIRNAAGARVVKQCNYQATGWGYEE